MKTSIILAAILTIGTFAAPALAEPATNQAVVEYADLDLSREAGRATFDRRLDQAIRQVCQPGWTRSAREAAATRACIAEKRAELAQVRSAIFAEAEQAASREDLALSPR